jgi:hypothetical protein
MRRREFLGVLGDAATSGFPLAARAGPHASHRHSRESCRKRFGRVEICGCVSAVLAFMAVAREGNFTKAVAKLSVSQSALSYGRLTLPDWNERKPLYAIRLSFIRARGRPFICTDPF